MAISKRNRRGIWVLILFCIALAYVPRVIAGLSENEVEISHEELKLAETELAEKQKKKPKRRQYTKKKKVYKSPPAAFDPNEYSKQDWMYLGLSEKQAEVVLKFTNRGIYSNEELRKVFVIPEEVFALLEDSTYYPDQYEESGDQIVQSNKSFEKVDLNTASYEELITVKGIGDFYAKKIIERREQLGGFIGSYQLMELWKFDAEKYDKIKDNIFVSKKVRKINVNQADFEELKNHPYISYKVANSIVKMRTMHGEYKQLEDLLNSVLIDQELFAKIQPYLTL